jgi:nucleoside-diphosphate-sugar epimerase
LKQLQGKEGFSFSRGDLADRVIVETLWKKHDGDAFDAVINLAARAGVRQSTENPYVYYETNVSGTLNLLELCRLGGVKKFVLASTSSLYGAENPRPFREDACTDRPLSPYAASKKAAEAMCYTWHFLYGMDVTVLRYFTVYGPAGRPDMSMFRFTQRISEGRPIVLYGDGTQERDFTYVDDIARGTVAALAPLGFETINLGGDQPVKILDVIAMIEELVGKKAVVDRQPAHPADVPATWADIGKARKLLGWTPQTKLEDGVHKLIEWYRAEQSWASQISTE